MRQRDVRQRDGSTVPVNSETGRCVQCSGGMWDEGPVPSSSIKNVLKKECSINGDSFLCVHLCYKTRDT